MFEQRYQRKKGQPLCKEFRQTSKGISKYIRHKKHVIVEENFRVICLNCGKVFAEMLMPQFSKTVKEPVKPNYKVVIGRDELTQMEKKMSFIYRNQADMQEALSRKLLLVNKRKGDKELSEEINALSTLLEH